MGRRNLPHLPLPNAEKGSRNNSPGRRMRSLVPALLLVCLANAGCRRQSKHVVQRVETVGATVEDNALLGMTPAQVNEWLCRKLTENGHFQLVERKSSGATADLSFQLELAFTREARKDGREGNFAEVGAMMGIRRKESEGFASYEVAGVGEVKISSNEPLKRREATRQALGKALDQVSSAAHLQLAALDKSDSALVKELGDQDARVREFAIRTLSARKNPAVEQALVEKLKGSDPEGVRRAIGGLVELKRPSSVPSLIELARGKDSGFLREIVFALGAIGGEEAEAYLYTVAQGHDQPAVRAAAQQALDELRGRTRRATDPRSDSSGFRPPGGSPQ